MRRKSPAPAVLQYDCHGVLAFSGPALTHGFQAAFYALVGLALVGAVHAEGNTSFEGSPTHACLRTATRPGSKTTRTPG